MPKITWDYTINGTDINPYEKYGLRYNPFPQHGQYELDEFDLALQSLDEPNMSPEEIKRRLLPLFTDAFVETVIKHYVPGERVHCTVVCEWGNNEKRQ